MRSSKWSVVTTLALAALIGSSSAGPTAAAFVTETFTGIITRGSLEYATFPGLAYTGTFSYDNSSAPQAGATATSASYLVATLTVVVPEAGFTFQSIPQNGYNVITVVHSPGISDSITISVGGTDSSGGYGDTVNLTLLDRTGTTLSSTALPPTIGLLPSFAANLSEVSHHAISGFGGGVTTLAPAAVPEPASAVLMLLSLTVAGFGRRFVRPAAWADRA